MNDTKSIRELLEMGVNGEFCKLGYQRPYEWTVKDILALLETLKENKFDIGSARINVISKDNEAYQHCKPLEYMEGFPLNKMTKLYAVVDFQQRLTTLLMFYNNHPKVKFIKYNIEEKKFVLSKCDKDTLIPVQALFNLMAKINWQRDKDMKTISLVEELFDRMTQTTINIEMHENLSIEEQAKWFTLLNGTGKKVSTTANKSCNTYVEIGKSFVDLSKPIDEIFKKNDLDYSTFNSQERFRINAMVSLLLPFTNGIDKLTGVPIGANLVKMNVKKVDSILDHALFIIDKACMFISKNIEKRSFIQVQAFVFFLANIDYNVFEEKITENDNLFEAIKYELSRLNTCTVGSGRIKEIREATERLKKYM